MSADVKRKPATPLPLEFDGKYLYGADGTPIVRVHPGAKPEAQWKTITYVVHSGNAYPKLIEALGELAYPHASADRRASAQTTARNLLRELGELP